MAVNSGYKSSALAHLVRRSVPNDLLDEPLHGIWFYLNSAILVLLFIGVNYFVNRLGYLPGSAYEAPSLFPGILERLGIVPAAGGLLLAGILLRYGSLWSRWSDLEHGQSLRWLIIVLTGLLTWFFVTLGYNYYYDQAYLIERVALLLLMPLVYFRPCFLLPYLVTAYAVLWQLDHPPLSAGAAWLHETHLMNVLSVFVAVFLLHAVTGSRRTNGFVFLALCLVAVAYWKPAVTKLDLDWLSYPSLHLMPLAAHAHGWLADLEAPTVIRFSEFIKPLNFPMQLVVLGLELGCIVMLSRRWVAVVLLLGLSIFHLGVFALYGYLFWTWIALNIGLAILICRLRRAHENLFDLRHLVLGGTLICFGSYWSTYSPLGWYDTRLSYTYRYQVVGPSGTVYALPVRFFSPYADVFTMANFGYLPTGHRMLVFPYGTTRVTEIKMALESVRNREEVIALEEKLGRARHEPERAIAFDEFVVRYLTHRNQRGPQLTALQALSPPPQFWSIEVDEPVYAGQEPVIEARVFEVTTLFDGSGLDEIRTIEIARLTVPGGRD